MRILVTNDDGIESEGIRRLAAVASQFGEVIVAAPCDQCSAMSQKLTIFREFEAKQTDLGIRGVKAYSVDGTPADCVKIAVHYLSDIMPDFLFSGINNGYNAGFDIAYSGTIGAAFEALQFGIPSIAFSKQFGHDYSAVDIYIEQIANDLVSSPPPPGCLYNVNFPNCSPGEVQGILTGRSVAKTSYYIDNYSVTSPGPGILSAKPGAVVVSPSDVDDGSDIDALFRNYISVGIVKNPVL